MLYASLRAPSTAQVVRRRPTRCTHHPTQPESVSVDHATGALLLLDKHGFLHRALPSDAHPGYVLHTQPPTYVGPGRPLASHMDSQGNLVICDTLKGLTMLDRQDRLSVLTNRVGLESAQGAGTLLRYVNDLDIAVDGGWRTCHGGASCAMHNEDDARGVLIGCKGCFVLG